MQKSDLQVMHQMQKLIQRQAAFETAPPEGLSQRIFVHFDAILRLFE
jgi:hypothetical protein